MEKISNTVYLFTIQVKASLAIIILLLFFEGCKKELDHPNHIEGRLTLFRYWVTDFTGATRTDTKYESAQAVFEINNYYTNDAGAVQYGDKNLIRDTSSIFYFSSIPGAPVANFDPALNGGRTWNVSGNPQNSIPAFSISAPDFPSLFSKDFDSVPIVDTTKPYTLHWDTSVPSDSILVLVSRGTKDIQCAVLQGNVSSFTFSPAQLSIFDPDIPTALIVLTIEGKSNKNIIVNGALITADLYARRSFVVKIVS